MTDSFRIEPILSLVSCPVARATRVETVEAQDITGEYGAIGVGLAQVPDHGSVLCVSLHTTDGETLIASLHQEDAAAVALLFAQGMKAAIVDNKATTDVKHIGSFYGMDQLIRAWVACGTVIELDEDDVSVSIGDV